jgi:UDP-glucose 4-epimerase
MKRALITGGAGFIGSHLAEHLLSEDYAVTIIDNLSTGRFENIATWKIIPASTTPSRISAARR